MANHFSNVAQTLQQTPQNQRPQKFADSIISVLQEASNQQTQQLGDELQEMTPQIVKAWQQS